jgi:Flp pilus assembly protein TadD
LLPNNHRRRKNVKKLVLAAVIALSAIGGLSASAEEHPCDEARAKAQQAIREVRAGQIREAAKTVHKAASKGVECNLSPTNGRGDSSSSTNSRGGGQRAD